MILNGTGTGPVHAAELLELQPHARVYGEVRYAALEMHQGAIVEGRLVPLVQAEIRALPNHVPASGTKEDAADAPADTQDAAEASEDKASDGASVPA